jgi:hypothetical protein
MSGVGRRRWNLIFDKEELGLLQYKKKVKIIGDTGTSKCSFKLELKLMEGGAENHGSCN